MQGRWSAHRRAGKVNLNNITTPPSGAQTPHIPDEVSTTPTPQETLPSDPTTPGPSTLEPTTISSSEARIPSSAATKRKTRSSRTGVNDEGISKRTKLSSAVSGSGGGIAKEYTPPSTRLSDLGGVDSCVEKMLELVAMPLCHPEIYIHTGVQPPRGVLLHGPPGCGKTLLANAIAGVGCFLFISTFDN